MIKKLRVSHSLILALILVTLAYLSSIFSGLGSAWADSVIDTIGVGNGPNRVAFNPSNNDMYVTDYFSNTVSVVDSSSNSVVDTIDVGNNHLT